MTELKDYNKEQIEIKVYAHNEINRYKAFISPLLQEVLKDYEGKSVLNKDMSLKANLKKALELAISTEYQPNKFKGFDFVKLNCWVQVSEYTLLLNIKLNFMTGVNSRGDMQNVYKEGYLYFASLDYKEGEGWSNSNYTQKVLKALPFEEVKNINLEEEYKLFLDAEQKKKDYEDALNKLNWDTQTLLR